MIYFFACNDYLNPIHKLDYDSNGDLDKICQKLEDAREDGFAVIAWRNCELLANSEGYAEATLQDEFDLACERRYDYAYDISYD